MYFLVVPVMHLRRHSFAGISLRLLKPSKPAARDGSSIVHPAVAVGVAVIAMSKRCNTQAIFLRKDVAREDFGMVAGPPPKRQEMDASGMRAWGRQDLEEDSWGSSYSKGKGNGKGKDKGWGKSWRDPWDDRGDYYDDMDGYGYGNKGKGWKGKDSGKGKNGGKGYGGYDGGYGGGYGGYGKGKSKGKSNGFDRGSGYASYSMHDERGDDRSFDRERSPRRGSAGSFGGRWKHDMFGDKGDSMDEFRNFGGRGPTRKGQGKGKGGKGKTKNGKPADPKQLDQELSKYFGKEADGLEKEHLDGELESYMGKEKEKAPKETKETKEADAKEKPAETAEK